MYRAYFAFINNPLINSRGENTSATFGFVNTILGLIRDNSPDYIAIAFDAGKLTFRNEMYDRYKATRQKMPDDLILQVPRVREAVDALGLYQVELEGFEADDIIATLTRKGTESGYDIFLVTGDKDLMQLIRPGVSMIIPAKKNELIGPENVVEKFGVPPEKIVDLLGLMGDSSDNVPGIPKVGEKTARDLLLQFGTLENVLDRFSEISKPSVRQAVEENRDLALLSKKLVTLRYDVPIEFDLGKMSFSGIHSSTARDFFREMGFTSLIGQVKEQSSDSARNAVIVRADNLDGFFESIGKQSEASVYIDVSDKDPMKASINGIAFAAGDHRWFLPFGHETGNNLDFNSLLPELRRLFDGSSLKLTGHDIKSDKIVLTRNGIDARGYIFDTMLAAYILDPGGRGYSIDILADENLGTGIMSRDEYAGKGKAKKDVSGIASQEAACFSCSNAEASMKLKVIFLPRIEKEELTDLYYNIELPLTDVLAEMELHGVLLDLDFLSVMSGELQIMIAEIEKNIYASAGCEFNINSPKQLAEILFDKIKLKSVKKTKTGLSTDVDVLEKLASSHELPRMILDYRQLVKLKSTYVDALPMLVNPSTGRVHAYFNQAVTSTGRLSSSEPNLQNIPIRTEIGRNIRKAFTAPPGYYILSADYSQIELRIMAHMSDDPVLKSAFNEGVDVHSRTASLLFNTFPEMVSPEQRRQAKTINFGVMYGMGAFALSEQLGIRRDEAKKFIDDYFSTNKGVKAFIDRTVEETERNGFVTTILGRKRWVPDINSSNHNIYEFAKRTAINTPIQGSAADLIKLAMINVDRRFKENNLKSSMVLQVHDELVFEVAGDELDIVREIVRDTMEGAIKLTVPVSVEMSWGINWLEAH